MESDASRMCELLVGLPDVRVIGIDDDHVGPLVVHVESRGLRGCRGCGLPGGVKDYSRVVLVDLPCFGRMTRLVWHKQRSKCRTVTCPVRTWTVTDDRIAAPRMALTDRAGRWATSQVGRGGRTVSDVGRELGCDWHTINDAVVAYGSVLVDDPDRIGTTTALGLDETLFVKTGKWRTKQWSTSIVDVEVGRLLDIVEGRDNAGACRWLKARGDVWCAQIRWATLDMSGPYRKVFNTMTPDAVQVADPFHVIKLANEKLDEVRRRVQNQTLGGRGLADDPLYRCRRLLVMAEERITVAGRERLRGLLAAGDPKGEVADAWHAKELVRQIYDHTDHGLAVKFVTQLGNDFQDPSCPPEIQQLGRTITKWKAQIAAWHQAHVTNGPTEAANNLIKPVKRVGFGFTRFRNYRIRVLLYAGKPNWDLLPFITPR